MTESRLESLRTRFCDNSRCKRGSGGTRKEFSPSRSWKRFCCPSCQGEAWRHKYHVDGEAIMREIDNLKMRVKKLERGV